jgi:DNA-binding transcriptional ArsR family regulator
MPEALRRENLLLCETGFFIITGWLTPPLPGENLPQYVDRATQSDPAALVNKMESLWVEKFSQHDKHHAALDLPDALQIFRDREKFVSFMVAVNEDSENVELWNEAFDLLQQPDMFVARVRQHIHTMWDDYLGEEWVRQLPLLNESIQAFQRVNLRDMTIYEAIRAVAGRDMRGKLDELEAHVDVIVFTPAPHLGPYIAKLPSGNTLRMLYGARLPRGVQVPSSALSRSELLIRMNALADDTRLRILEMLTRQDEVCAQDIIEALNLSQSSVSRHLSQLSATGFVIERRRDVNKCYSLNVDRVVDTVRALTNFLAKE